MADLSDLIRREVRAAVDEALRPVLELLKPTAMSSTMLTPAQVVDRYAGRLTANTLRNWRAKGRGPPFVRLGGRVVYRLEDLVAWERGQRDDCAPPDGQEEA